MKVKTVKRYWCDHCNKAGLQAHSMAKHEKHCTLNPDRDCRVCGLLGGSVRLGAERMAELVAILPANVPYEGDNYGNPSPKYSAFCDALRAATPALRTETWNCPACIMAAIRQAGIPVPMVEFDFKGEMQSIFNDINAQRQDDRGY